VIDWRKLITDLWPTTDPNDPDVQKRFSRRAFLISTSATAAAIAIAPSALLDVEPELVVTPTRTIWQVPADLAPTEYAALFSAARGDKNGLQLDTDQRLTMRAYLDGLRRRPVA
jgi:hypothetical protein